MSDDTFLFTNPQACADAIEYHRNIKDMETAKAMLDEGRRLWPEVEGRIWVRFRFLDWGFIS